MQSCPVVSLRLEAEQRFLLEETVTEVKQIAIPSTPKIIDDRHFHP
jgi:hypothetical protein